MKFRHFWHRGSVALFTVVFSLLLSVGLASAFSLFGGESIRLTLSTDTPEDEGGAGYEADDDCGFMMGSRAYANATLDFSGLDNDEQGCLDAFAGASTGSFHSDSDTESYVNLTYGKTTMVVDLAPDTVKIGNRVNVDLTTGQWSGYGKIISPTVPKGQEWVWFDWTCQKGYIGCVGGSESSDYVTTNMDTGVTVGYAWSDYLSTLRGDGNGYISFKKTVMEVPPMVIVPFIEIEANETEFTPAGVDRVSAPQANGIDYWRVGIYFVDMVTGLTLDESDVNRLTMSLNTTDSVFMNQVENAGDAVDIGAWHPVECSSTTAASDPYCLITKDDGTVTFNKFVRSYAPTSNMVWMTEEVALVEQDLPTDRGGCVWIYQDQLDATPGGSPRNCALDTAVSVVNSINPNVKWDYFYARSDDRNYIYLDDITFFIELETSQDYSISTDGQFASIDNGYYQYTPSYTELSFAPRFYLDGLYAEYDGSLWTTISDEISKSMKLQTTGAAYSPSMMLSDYLGASLNDRFGLVYQLDSSIPGGGDQTSLDRVLVMDVVDENIPDPANNVTWYVESPANLDKDRNFSSIYPMGYAQEDSCSVPPGCGPATNGIETPTAELWVCDATVAQVIERRIGSGKSCYYVGYLPVVDRHADPGGVFFMGSTGEFLGLSLDESDDIYEGGAQETIKLRNNFYELGTRYTLGVSAGAGTLSLDSASPVTGGESLMGGNLYYFNGDVTVSEATSFTSGTLYVLGGDVYIDGDIGSDSSRLGIIALEEDGTGGNIYIDPSATDLYVNIFADGGIYSDSEALLTGGYPSWLNDAYRMATLKNQLYINGSFSARMILNASDVYDELGYYTCGEGEVTEAIANECSLENLRQFRLCYELDSTGSPTTTTELCDEGEELSDYGTDYAATYSEYPSVILEYAAPGNLPIFASEGIFN